MMPIPGPPSSAGPSSRPLSTIPSEALALSASTFLTSIDSWIPSNFGVTRTPEEKEAEFNLFLREERGERYGLGHPSFNLPPAQRNGAGSRGALTGLSKKMEADRKAIHRGARADGDSNTNEKGKGKESQRNGQEDDSEEEESRMRVLAKKKKSQGLGDMFGGKKKKKDPFAVAAPVVAPGRAPKPAAAILSPSIAASGLAPTSGTASTLKSASSTPRTPTEQRLTSSTSLIAKEGEEGDEDESEDRPPFPPSTTESRTTPPTGIRNSSPGGSGVFPYDGPRPFGSPTRSGGGSGLALELEIGPRGTKRSADDDDDDEASQNGIDPEEGRDRSGSTNGPLTKSAISIPPSKSREANGASIRHAPSSGSTSGSGAANGASGKTNNESDGGKEKRGRGEANVEIDAAKSKTQLRREKRKMAKLGN